MDLLGPSCQIDLLCKLLMLINIILKDFIFLLIQ